MPEIPHSPRPRSPARGPLAWLLALGTAIVTAVAALAGAVLMVGALLVGAFVAFAVLVWALLRGRKLMRSGRFGAFGQPPRQPQPPGQVIDVEVREVPETAPRSSAANGADRTGAERRG